VQLLVRLLPCGASGAEEGGAMPATASRQDDIIRFCWDRIMWGGEEEEGGGAPPPDLPLNACKVTTEPYDRENIKITNKTAT
jgi:hypothetical protein